MKHIEMPEQVGTEFTNIISKSRHRDMLVRKASGQPIDPGDVYVSPEVTSFSTGFMMDQNLVSMRMAPSVPVEKQAGSYPEYARSHMLRDEMQPRADSQESPSGTMGLSFTAFKALVYSWKIGLGAQAKANMSPLELDQVAALICGNKAALKRETLWFNKFYKTGVWTTQVQHKTSGGGGTAGVDLSFKDASALPIKQIKAALDSQSALTGDLYRANKAVFSKDVWTAVTEHPNVINRVNAGQTPGGPAEVTKERIAQLLEIDEVIVAGGIQTTSNENATDAYARLATSGQLLLAYVPPKPAKVTPSAMYTIDWVPPDSLVGGYGNAIASWYDQNKKTTWYEIEMGTAPQLVSADCGVLLYSLLA